MNRDTVTDWPQRHHPHEWPAHERRLGYPVDPEAPKVQRAHRRKLSGDHNVSPRRIGLELCPIITNPRDQP